MYTKIPFIDGYFNCDLEKLKLVNFCPFYLFFVQCKGHSGFLRQQVQQTPPKAAAAPTSSTSSLALRLSTKSTQLCKAHLCNDTQSPSQWGVGCQGKGQPTIVDHWPSNDRLEYALAFRTHCISCPPTGQKTRPHFIDAAKNCWMKLINAHRK